MGLGESKQGSPTNLKVAIGELKNDPDVIQQFVEHDERSKKIDQQAAVDLAQLRNQPYAQPGADPLAMTAVRVYRKLQRKQDQEQEQEKARYDESLRQVVAKKSPLKLTAGSDVEKVLFAPSGRKAQIEVENFLVDGKAMVREARMRLEDLGFLYAADMVIAEEKKRLRGALGANSTRVENTTPIGQLVSTGLESKRGETIDWIIDHLAEERRSQTTTWQDLWRVLEIVSNFIPGTFGWAVRSFIAGMNFGRDLEAVGDQRSRYATGLSSVAPQSNVGGLAAGTLLQIGTDLPLSRGAKLGESVGRLTLTSGERLLTKSAADEAKPLLERAATSGEHEAALTSTKSGIHSPAGSSAFPDIEVPAVDRPISETPQLESVSSGENVGVETSPKANPANPASTQAQSVKGNELSDIERAYQAKNAKTAAMKAQQRKVIQRRRIAGTTNQTFSGEVDDVVAQAAGEDKRILQNASAGSVTSTPVAEPTVGISRAGVVSRATREDLLLAKQRLKDADVNLQGAADLLNDGEKKARDLEDEINDLKTAIKDTPDEVTTRRLRNKLTEAEKKLEIAQKNEEKWNQLLEQRKYDSRAIQSEVETITADLTQRGELQPSLDVEWNLPDNPVKFRYKGVEVNSCRPDAYVGASDDRRILRRLLNEDPERRARKAPSA